MSYRAKVLADAPYAFYRLDEASGSILADRSGNGRTGAASGILAYRQSVSGAFLDPVGIVGMELGVTSQMVLGDSAELSGATQITVEFLAKCLSIPATAQPSPPALFFIKAQAGNWQPALAIYLNNNNIQVTARTTLAETLSASVAFTDTTAWNHWVFHIDFSGDSITIYLNSQRVAVQAAAFANNEVTLVGDVQVGMYFDVNSMPVYGQFQLSNISIYKNKAFGWGVASRHYHALGSPVSSSVLDDSPVVYWKFNEASGTDVIDYSGNNRPATVANPTQYRQSNPLSVTEPLAGIQTNGTTTTITGPNPAFLSAITTLTVAFWFKAVNTAVTDGYIVSGSTATAANVGFAVGFNANTLKLYGRSAAADTLYTASVPFNDLLSWHHAVAHWNWTTKRFVLLLDGLPVIDSVANVAFSSTTFTSCSAIRVGCYYNGSTHTNFAAVIAAAMAWWVNQDSAFVLRRLALQSFQIAQSKPASDNAQLHELAHYYPLVMGFSHQVAANSTTNSSSPALVLLSPNFSQVMGTMGTATYAGPYFNQSGGRLIAPITLDTTSGFVISVCARVEQNTNSGVLFHLSAGAGLHHAIRLTHPANSLDLTLSVFNGLTAVATITAPNALSKSRGKLIAAVWDAAAFTLGLWVDGVLAASTALVGPLPAVARNWVAVGAGPKAMQYQPPDPYYNHAMLRVNFNHLATVDEINVPYAAYSAGVKAQANMQAGSPMASPLTALFGQTAQYFNGQSAMSFMSRDADLGVGDFWVEFWVWVQQYNTSSQVIFAGKWSQSTVANACWLIGLTTNSYLAAYFGPYSTSSALGIDTVAFPLRTWTHVAFGRSGSTFYLFKNGVKINLATSAVTQVPVPAVETSLGNCFNSSGVLGASGTNYFMGSITGLSIYRGIIKTTNSFTPAFRLPPGVVNPESPQFLLHFNGANASTTMTDDGGHTMTVVGNAQLSTTQFKFGPSSAYFDGAGDGVRCQTNVPLIQWDDFTISCWVYPINGGRGQANARVFETALSGNAGGIAVVMVNNESPARVQFQNTLTGNTNPFLTSTNALPNTAWSHVAVGRRNGVFFLAVNGVFQTANTTNYALTSMLLSLGSDNSSTQSFYGYIDEFLVEIGQALYYQDFSDALPKAPHWAGYNPYADEVYRNYVALGIVGSTNYHSAGTSVVYDFTGKSITVAGTPTWITTSTPSYSPNYGLSLAFNGTTDYLTLAAHPTWDWGTITGNSQYTMEFWVKPITTSAMTLLAHGLPGSAGTGNRGWSVRLANGVVSVAVGDPTTGHAVYATSASVITMGQWHTVAITLDSGVPRILIDGLITAGTFTVGSTFIGKDTTYLSEGLRIGASLTDSVTTTPTEFLNGNLWNIRLTHSVCRYHRYYPLFRTPYPEYNVIDYTNDIFADSDVLWMDFEGANNSTAFADKKGHAITVSGAAKLSTTTAKTGSTSGWFDGTSGCYVDVTTGAEFVLSADFTIELLAYFTDLTGVQGLLSKWVTWSSNVDFYLQKDINNKINFSATDAIPLTVTSNSAVVANQWTHIVVTRVGYHTKLFINGLPEASYVASTAQPIPNDKTTLRIGANQAATPGEYFKGYIDQLSISTISHYSSTNGFPMWLLPWVGGVTVEIPFEGVHNSTMFLDATGQPLTRNGTPIISTTQFKLGNASGYFNGVLATDYLALPASRGNLGNVFTVECWCWPASVPTVQPTAASAGQHSWCLFGQGGSGASQDQYFSFTESRKFMFGRSSALAGGTLTLTSTNVFAIQTWHHIALCADGTTWRLFVDGNLEASATSSTSWVNTGNTFDVGRELVAGYPTLAAYWDGYIDQFKITNGACSYLANFTPLSTAPVPYSEDSFTGWLTDFSVGTIPWNQRELIRNASYWNDGLFVNQAYKESNSLVAYWPLAESTGAVAHDVLGGAHGNYSAATLNQSESYAMDRIIKPLATWDGLNTTLTLPKLPAGTEFSIGLMIKGRSVVLEQCVLDVTVGSARVLAYLQTPAAQRLRVTVKTVSGDVSVTIALNALQKNFIIITVKESNAINLYLNGLLAGSSAITTFANMPSATNRVGSSSVGDGFANMLAGVLLLFNKQLSAADVSAIYYQAFSANNIHLLIQPTLSTAVMAMYQILYYIRGEVRLDSILTEAWIYLYASESGSFEGRVKSDPISGIYEWRTTSNQFYNVVCIPIYNQKEWKPRTNYNVGDVVLPYISNGYWYRCMTAGQSDVFAEPIWPTVINSTVADGSVVWKCVDVLSRGQVHGPLLPYDMVRAQWRAATHYYPAQQLTVAAYGDSGSVQVVNDIPVIYLNGSTASAVAGVNVMTASIALGTLKTVSVAFKRTKTGAWFDDDFTDAQLTIYFVVDQSPASATFGTSSWQYYRPSNLDASKRAIVNFRATAGLAVGVNDATTGVTTSNGGFTAGHSNGTTTTKLVFTYDQNYFQLAVLEGGIVKYTKADLFSVLNPQNFYILFHYHNYLAVPHQELITGLEVLTS